MTDLLNPIAAPENATIGDSDVRNATVGQVNEQVASQVTGPPAVEVPTVRVSETHVKLDQVITDPSSPLAVQIPDAGRGPLDLPIHRLSGPKPEDVFAAIAAEGSDDEDEPDEDD